MANQEIITRLIEKLNEYVDGKMEKYEFKEFMNNSINALEGIDDKILEEARHLEYKIEVAEFHYVNNSIQKPDSVIAELRIWLSFLK